MNAHRQSSEEINEVFTASIPSPISILVFFALKTHDILCTEVSCGYYILCAVKSKNKFLILAKVLQHKKTFRLA